MAVQTTIKIKGLEELISRMSKFDNNLKREINNAIKTSIFDLESKVKPVTPIDTGRLRSGFTTSFSEFKGELTNVVEYAIYVHEGTSRWPISMPPKNSSTVRQFLIKGAQLSAKKIQKNFEIALNKTVRKLGRRF